MKRMGLSLSCDLVHDRAFGRACQGAFATEKLAYQSAPSQGRSIGLGRRRKLAPKNTEDTKLRRF